MHRLPPPPLPPVDMAAVPPLDGGQVVVPLGRLLHGRDDPVVEAGEQHNWDHTWESHRLWLEQSLSVSELVFLLEDGGDGMTLIRMIYIVWSIMNKKMTKPTHETCVASNVGCCIH